MVAVSASLSPDPDPSRTAEAGQHHGAEDVNFAAGHHSLLPPQLPHHICQHVYR